MMFRTFALFYGVGLMLGLLGLCEWIYERVNKVWLAHVVVSAASLLAGLLFWVADRRRNHR